MILIVAFGALVAAGLPLLLALTAVMGTIGLLGPVSQIVPLDEAISSVVLLVGLAVGVDYCMFYLRREMEERDAGRGAEAALEAAAATSGRAVLISGITVIVAMAGMFLAGSSVFTSFGVGTILVVAVAVLGSITVLPAMLSWLGQKGWTEKGRVPYLSRLRHRNHGESRVWGAILDRVLKRPAISAALATILLLALALPALGIHTINPGVAGLPRSLPIMQTYDRIQDKFPGGPLPASVVVQADDVNAPAVQAGIAELKQTAADTKGFGQPVTVTTNPEHTLAMVDIPLAGDGTDARSEAALATLRDDVVPQTIGKVSGAEVNVTGMTAGSKDFNDVMKSRLPIVFAFVLGLAFILLLVTFRSIVIPIKAIVLNLLSVGAAYGILKLVFQDGHGESLLGFHSIGGDDVVAAAVPVRDPVRALDGLPRVHPQPDPRGGRRRHEHRPRGRPRHQADRRRRDERGDRDGRGVLDLRDAELARVQADGRRPRGRGPDRRDDRAGRAAARDDEAARRLELVPAEAAELAAEVRARAGAGAGQGVGSLPPHAQRMRRRPSSSSSSRAAAATRSPRSSSSPRATRSASASTSRSRRSPTPRPPRTSSGSRTAPSSISDPAIKDMEALEPPGELESDFDKFVASLKRQRDLTKKIGAAAGEGDTAEVQKIGADAQKAQDEYRRLTGKLGFKQCGGGV